MVSHFKSAPQPANVDWDLWFGPAPQRSYSEGIHPFHWSKFWDYGTGSLGDFGCHFPLHGPDPLGPETAQPGSHRCHRARVRAGQYTSLADRRVRFPGRAKLPPVKLRRAASQVACTAGKSRPTKIPMMATTTANSINVKARREVLEKPLIVVALP